MASASSVDSTAWRATPPVATRVSMGIFLVWRLGIMCVRSVIRVVLNAEVCCCVIAASQAFTLILPPPSVSTAPYWGTVARAIVSPVFLVSMATIWTITTEHRPISSAKTASSQFKPAFSATPQPTVSHVKTATSWNLWLKSATTAQ